MIAGRTGLLACVGICVSLLGRAERAAAAPAFTVDLRYAADAGCPDTAAFTALVMARLGRDPFMKGAPDHVLVRIVAQDGRLAGGIEWRDAAGNWTGDQAFPGVNTDCLRLVRTIGFALAVQIQLLESRRATSVPAVPAVPGPPSLATVPARAEPEPSARAPAPPARSPARATRSADTSTAAPTVPAPVATQGPVFAMGAGPAVGVGMSSPPTLLGRAFAALMWERLSLELAGGASVPVTTRRADGAGFSQQYLLVSAAACGIVRRWNACVVANAGEVRLLGDIDRPASAWVPVVQAGVRTGLIQRVGPRVFLSAHADGLIILTRWTAKLDQIPVWTAPPFAAVLGVDVGVRFR